MSLIKHGHRLVHTFRYAHWLISEICVRHFLQTPDSLTKMISAYYQALAKAACKLFHEAVYFIYREMGEMFFYQVAQFTLEQ